MATVLHAGNEIVFRPGEVWLDTAGQPINAHGGGILVRNGTCLESVRPEGRDSRDQTLFQDDDGKAYRIYSSEKNDTTYISLLTDDYLKHSGQFVRVFEKRRMEAQVVFKHAGKIRRKNKEPKNRSKL